MRKTKLIKKADAMVSKVSKVNKVNKVNIKELFPLTPHGELFVLAFTTRGETFCNNTKSYAEAYQYDLPRRDDGSIETKSEEYHICKSNGGRMLFNPSIRQAIQDKFLEYFNEKVADARVSEIMLNGKDADALQAVKIFNDLRQRVTKKIDVNVTARPLAGMSDEELEKLAAE